MPDMLVKLYDLQSNWDIISEQKIQGIEIRKPVGPEKRLIINWVEENFFDAWAGEIDIAISNKPITCFIAIKDQELIGFSCYDATALGYFGPMGIKEAFQGRGTGKALLMACLLDMKLKGYGYAIIGAVEILQFYRKAVDAMEIPESSSGILKTCLKINKK
jgi:ribosomal protein S18 acetylase RimI-like enzyme